MPKTGTGTRPRVYIIILNWNGWRDTISCLESVIRLDYDNYSAVVCDNGSTDDSVAKILDWAKAEWPMRGRAGVVSLVNANTPAARPIGTAEPGGELFLLQNQGNLGFAGGNNAGLKFALARGDLDYVWLLNNDTVVEPRSLAHLVEKMQSTEGVGICGSTLMYYNETQTVQARGASYSKWFARSRPIDSLARASEPVDENECARKMDYVVGASMLVSREFLEDVGLISEEYFLYFEELDWMLRARRKYRLAYASRSIVYHKGGQATGATTANKSFTGEYYVNRGRILFTRKFYPHALPTVLLAIGGSMLVQVLKGRFRMARTILHAALDGVRGRTGVRLPF
jgi:GT2 family glycosyltransferase